METAAEGDFLTTILTVCPTQKPTSDDGGDYKCVVKNDLRQLQAKLYMNILAEPVVGGTPAAINCCRI